MSKRTVLSLGISVCILGLAVPNLFLAEGSAVWFWVALIALGSGILLFGLKALITERTQEHGDAELARGRRVLLAILAVGVQAGVVGIVLPGPVGSALVSGGVTLVLYSLVILLLVPSLRRGRT